MNDQRKAEKVEALLAGKPDGPKLPRYRYRCVRNGEWRVEYKPRLCPFWMNLSEYRFVDSESHAKTHIERDIAARRTTYLRNRKPVPADWEYVDNKE